MLQRVLVEGREVGQTDLYTLHPHPHHYHCCREFQRKVEEVARRERARNQKLETEAALAVTYPDPNEP